jgi:hypothetical protein
MREVTALSNAKSRVTVLYECGVCHRRIEAVVDAKRGNAGSDRTRTGARTRHDVAVYRAALRTPRPLPEPEASPEVEPEGERPKATPIRHAPKVRVTRRRD